MLVMFKKAKKLAGKLEKLKGQYPYVGISVSPLGNGFFFSLSEINEGEKYLLDFQKKVSEILESFDIKYYFKRSDYFVTYLLEAKIEVGKPYNGSLDQYSQDMIYLSFLILALENYEKI